MCACEWVNICSKGIPAGSLEGTSSYAKQQFFSRYHSQGSNMSLSGICFFFIRSLIGILFPLPLYQLQFSFIFIFVFTSKNLKKKSLSLKSRLMLQLLYKNKTERESWVCVRVWKREIELIKCLSSCYFVKSVVVDDTSSFLHFLTRQFFRLKSIRDAIESDAHNRRSIRIFFLRKFHFRRGKNSRLLISLKSILPGHRITYWKMLCCF